MANKQKPVTYTYTPINEDQSVAQKIIDSPIGNLKIVFFNPDDTDKPVKGFYDMVVRTNKLHGTEFRGPRSGKYGMRVAKNSTHFAIAAFGSHKITRLYTLPVPQPHSTTVVCFGEKYRLTVRRADKNIFLIFAENNQKQNRAKIVKPSKLDSVNDKWTQL